MRLKSGVPKRSVYDTQCKSIRSEVILETTSSICVSKTLHLLACKKHLCIPKTAEGTVTLEPTDPVSVSQGLPC